MSLQSPDKAAAKASGKRGAAASNSEDTKRRRNEPRRYFNDERKPAFYLCKDCGARCSPDCAVADMMFGFGDVERPLQSTVDVVEDVVTSYLRNLVQKAASTSAHEKRLAAEDILLCIRNDPVKYQRAVDLLNKWDDIKEAKQNNLEVDGVAL